MTLRRAYDGCPLCGGESAEFGEPFKDKLYRQDIQWMRCTACGHVHAQSYWTAEGLEHISSVMRAEQVFGGELDHQRSVWCMVIHRIVEHLGRVMPLPHEGRWIDVGTGNGSFVFTADEFGYDAIGLDIRPQSINALKLLGYKAELTDVMQYDYSGAEVVALADILEHVSFPRALLERIRRGMKNGVLFVSCPNMDSVSWRYNDKRRKNPYWSEAEHLHNFTRKSLTALLRSCGFHVQDYSVSRRYGACMEIIAI
jgi:protein O-GlcNAc transferase